MTTARVGLDEYCKKHQIEDHLTEAVNACYAAQSEHPLASLAHHFVGKGLTHRLHSVAAAPVHCAAASGDWGAGLQIDISVNGRAVGGAATGLLPPDEFGGGGQLEAAARRIAAELSEKLAGAEVSVAGHVSDFDPACEGSESLRHHPAVQAAASLASVQAISRLRGRQDADTVSSIRLALSHPLNTTHHLDIHDPTQCTSPVPILWLVTPKPAATKLPFSIGLLHLGRAAPHEKADFLLESLRALHKALNSPGEASASAGPPGVFTHVLPSGALSPALDTGIDAALDEVSNTLAQHFGRDEGKNGDRNLRDLRFALKVDASHLRKKIRQAPQSKRSPLGVFTHVLPSGALSPAPDTGIDAALDEVSNTLAQHFGRDEVKNGDRNLRDLRFALKVDASHLRKKIRQAPQALTFFVDKRSPPGVFTHVLPSGALSPALDTGIDAVLDEVSNTLAQHVGRDEVKNGDRNLRDLRFALKVDASHLRQKIRQAPQ
ncbi:hypothetical protein DIPPA_00500, partial [Diplonema papillatum]